MNPAKENARPADPRPIRWQCRICDKSVTVPNGINLASERRVSVSVSRLKPRPRNLLLTMSYWTSLRSAMRRNHFSMKSLVSSSSRTGRTCCSGSYSRAVPHPFVRSSNTLWSIASTRESECPVRTACRGAQKLQWMRDQSASTITMMMLMMTDKPKAIARTMSQSMSGAPPDLTGLGSSARWTGSP